MPTDNQTTTREDRAEAYRHTYGCEPEPDSWTEGWVEDGDSEPERSRPLDRLADRLAASRRRGITIGYLSAVVTMLRTPPLDWDLAHRVLSAACIKPADVKGQGFSAADRVLLMGALKLKR